MFPFMNLVGMGILIFIAFLFSKHRKAIRWRTVLLALLIQWLFGGFVLYVPLGQSILEAVSNGFVRLLSFAKAGSEFIFGALINQEKFDYVFALDVFPTIIYLSSLIAVLYYLGIMGMLIRGIGGFLRLILGTTRAESLATASAIFIGNPELTVRPYLNKMTTSELFVVMVAAMATISGEVVGGYVGLGIPANFIIAASCMSAPGAILFAKLLIPETEKSTDDEYVKISYKRQANVLEAAASGATDGMFICLNVAAMLIAFLSLIALINGVLGWAGNLVGWDHLSLQWLLAKLLKYLMFLIGVPWQDTEFAAQMVGLKTITNEFVGYFEFSKYINMVDGVFSGFKDIDYKTGVMVSFALCGYANIGSIAVYLGSIGYLAPERKHDLARFGLYALLAASLSNLNSAAIAGFFISL
ncbi:NupC/NupG family nucleoside CNT transporter [Psittacicella gerlachiana]|uniref:Nucleoside permease n=1 Tax=Psittacicella gerlachiana TaxID=2028574 RepID=A0A3A1YMN2_9GAMM|nr:nucleoside transporter C-terminal domain-containing protein [Psittacicella gerlachiana]RIY37524.1 hypothetical protein CKF59_01610 [Psittacicella gerlachiana]